MLKDHNTNLILLLTGSESSSDDDMAPNPGPKERHPDSQQWLQLLSRSSPGTGAGLSGNRIFGATLSNLIRLKLAEPDILVTGYPVQL